MTSLAPEPLIPHGYALARLMATDRHKAEEVVRRACRRYIEEHWAKVETMMKAYGVREIQDPEEWLAHALLIPDATWQEYAAKYPERYAKRWEKFQRLRQRALDGGFAGAPEEADRIVREASRSFSGRY